MKSRICQRGARLLLVVGLVLCLLIIVGNPEPDRASIHEYPESSCHVSAWTSEKR